VNQVQRRAAGGLAVAACVLATAFAARGMRKPPVENAPPHRAKGAEASKITIVEFSDFQCPACRVAEQPLKAILDLYGKDVRFIFKHFPLERVHSNARSAAIAAECMGKQGKFWQFHDALYENQAEWGELQDPGPKFEKYQKAAGADLDALKACAADPAVSAAIDADVKEAGHRWVRSTPTFFVNGRRFVGGKQLSTRGSLWIEKELKR
jgi:protein-disulfide isomerase